jgi:hypothetical protein
VPRARTAAQPTARRPRPVRAPLGALLCLAATALALAFTFVPIAPAARPVAAAGGVTLQASALLAGHGRVGSWMAIAVTVANDGPGLTGELRINGGAQGRTRFGLPVDLPTGSRKSLELYAQPPAFGQTLDVSLVTTAGTAATAKVTYSVPDNAQLVVGVLAEKPAPVVAALRLPPSVNGTPAVIVQLTVADLPGRVEAWDPIDRLVWQDVDASTLRPDQLAAMRGWLAGGGRLTIVGGTSGASSLAGLPDDLLPYRPRATTDISPKALQDLVGPIATSIQTIPAMTGDRSAVHGRILAASGDQVFAAEATFGSGAVTLLGVDPTGDWLARTPASDAVWNRLVPPRSLGAQLVTGDDSQMLNALNTLPSLALPPIGGLLILLFGYILLVGPLNYLLLRRLDRREWAWVTMPLLVVGFAAAAYLYGNTLRGGQVIINSVAIVHGAPDTTVATATAYVGVFSPTRETYQLEIPGGALLSPPTSGDLISGFDGTQNGGILDILQGDTARVRDLAVGYGSLRAVRAEVPVTGPQVTAVLRLEGDHLTGTVTNKSTMTLEKPAVVVGSSVAVLADLAPEASVAVDLPVGTGAADQPIADRILGSAFFGGQPFGGSPDDQRLLVRQAILNQLTFDQMTGMSTTLSTDGAVLLAFGRGDIVGARLTGTPATSSGDVLYFVPLPIAIHGQVTFTGDLMQGTTVSSDGQVNGKGGGGGPAMIFFQGGTLTQAYRPPSFDGVLSTSKLVLAVNQNTVGAPGGIVQPSGPGDAPLTAQEQTQSSIDGMPVIELFDRTSGAWVRLAHFSASSPVSVAEPGRYVDPTSGTVLVRFRTGDQNGLGFSFQVQLEGTVQ